MSTPSVRSEASARKIQITAGDIIRWLLELSGGFFNHMFGS